MSIKTNTIRALWPDSPDIRALAMQAPEMPELLSAYCAAAHKPKLRDHFAGLVEAVELRFAAGERAKIGEHRAANPTYTSERLRRASATRDRIRDRSWRDSPAETH